MKRYTIGGLAAALIALATVSIQTQAHDKHHHAAKSKPLIAIDEEQLRLPNLPVTDSHGRKTGFRDAFESETPIILSFTYTNCETLCPATNAILREVDKKLGTESPRAATIVSLGIDAIRDTSESLRLHATELGASEEWVWLTGGTKGTRPLLEALRFPPGELEQHDPIFLVGRPCRGLFARVVGLPNPDALIALAREQQPCPS